MTTTKHLYDMTREELALVLCTFCGVNAMDEYACRNNLKDNYAYCSECCADELEDSGASCCG